MPKSDSGRKKNDILRRQGHIGKRKAVINRGISEGRYESPKNRVLVQKDIAKQRFTITLPTKELAQMFYLCINQYNKDRTVKDTVLYDVMKGHRALKKRSEKQKYNEKIILPYLMMALPDKESVERWLTEKKTVRKKWLKFMKNDEKELVELTEQLKAKYSKGKDIEKIVKRILTYVKHA